MEDGGKKIIDPVSNSSEAFLEGFDFHATSHSSMKSSVSVGEQLFKKQLLLISVQPRGHV